MTVYGRNVFMLLLRSLSFLPSSTQLNISCSAYKIFKSKWGTHFKMQLNHKLYPWFITTERKIFCDTEIVFTLLMNSSYKHAFHWGIRMCNFFLSVLQWPLKYCSTTHLGLIPPGHKGFPGGVDGSPPGIVCGGQTHGDDITLGGRMLVGILKKYQPFS
jgi:hypothetical protein